MSHLPNFAALSMYDSTDLSSQEKDREKMSTVYKQT